MEIVGVRTGSLFREESIVEVADVILFLASDLSSYMTGEVVSVSSQHP